MPEKRKKGIEAKPGTLQFARGPQTNGTPKQARSRLRFPDDVIIKPPLSEETLKILTENDPEGADEFVALIRALRNEGSRAFNL